MAEKTHEKRYECSRCGAYKERSAYDTLVGKARQPVCRKCAIVERHVLTGARYSSELDRIHALAMPPVRYLDMAEIAECQRKYQPPKVGHSFQWTTS